METNKNTIATNIYIEDNETKRKSNLDIYGLPISQLVKASVFAGLAVVTDFFYLSIMPVSIVNKINLQLLAIFLFLGATQVSLPYALGLGICADFIIGFSNPYGYLPLYIFSNISWVLFPRCIVNNRRSSFLQILIAVFAGYLFSTFTNSFASYYYFNIPLMVSIIPRCIAILAFTPIFSYIIYSILVKTGTVNFVKRRK